MRTRGSGMLHDPKVLSFRLDGVDYDAAMSSGVSPRAIFRKGLEVCLITQRTKQDVLLKLAQHDLEMANEHEQRALSYRNSAHRIMEKLEGLNGGDRSQV